LLGAGTLADVAGDPRATLAELGGGGFEHLGPAAGDHNLSAAARQFGRRRLAQVGPATGDDRATPLQRAVGEDARGRHGYSPSTLITSRLGRRPSNSQ